MDVSEKINVFRGYIQEGLDAKGEDTLGIRVYHKDIPPKKMSNITKALNIPVEEEILLLLDTTFFGSAKEGLVVSPWGIRYRPTIEKPWQLSWDEISEKYIISIHKNEKGQENLVLRNGNDDDFTIERKIELYLAEINVELLKRIVKKAHAIFGNPQSIEQGIEAQGQIFNNIEKSNPEISHEKPKEQESKEEKHDTPNQAPTLLESLKIFLLENGIEILDKVDMCQEFFDKNIDRKYDRDVYIFMEAIKEKCHHDLGNDVYPDAKKKNLVLRLEKNRGIKKEWAATTIDMLYDLLSFIKTPITSQNKPSPATYFTGTILRLGNEVCSIAYHPSGNILIVNSKDKNIRLINTENGNIIKVIQDDSSGVVVSPDGRSYAGISVDSSAYSIKVREIQTGNILRTLVNGKKYTSIRALAYSPDGKHIAAAVGDSVLVTDIDMLSLVGVINTHTDTVFCVKFSPDGQYLASGAKDTRVVMSDMSDLNIAELGVTETGIMVYSLNHKGHNYVRSVDFSPDGNYLLTLSNTNPPIIWNTNTRKIVRKLTPDDAVFTSILYSPDGRFIAGGTKDGTMIIYSASEGNQILSGKIHDDSINDSAFSPNSRFIATASSDGTAIVSEIPCEYFEEK
jgi:hypothetical protein